MSHVSRHLPRRPLRAVATGLAALALAGCAAPGTGQHTDPPHPPTTSSPAAPAPSTTASGTAGGERATSSPDGTPGARTETPRAAPGTALAGLSGLEVKGRAPKTGYARDRFGTRWADTDHNGCDTRNDVLRRDLTGITVKAGTRGCRVATGVLVSPFTQEHIDFRAGAATSDAVQIDHVVALSDAWQKGAQRLDGRRREEFANDPLNLLAVDGTSNNAKSDGDAATWLPPAVTFRCEYVATQISVKLRYDLWVTPAEKEAMAEVLETCPGQPLPSEAEIPPPSPTTPVHSPGPPPPAQPAPPVPEAPTGRPGAPGTPRSDSGPVPAPDGSVYYPNCAAARAAGVAPLHAGSPGYRPQLDGDGDGVACEPRKR